MRMHVRFYTDPGTGYPHIHNHEVDEHEVEHVLASPGEDRPGRDGSRVAIGQTEDGRYLRVIYVPEAKRGRLSVITAYELRGKPLTAFRGFPSGWDEARVRRLLEHYESQTEEQAIAEDEESFADKTQTVMEIRNELVPKARGLNNVSSLVMGFLASDRKRLWLYRLASCLLLAASLAWFALSGPPTGFLSLGYPNRFMFVTGLVATWITLLAGILSEGEFPMLLGTLHDAELIYLTEKEERRFRTWHRKVQFYIHCAFVVTLLLAGTIVAANISWSTGPIIFAYAVSGMRIGRLSANGVALRWLRKHQIEVSLIPGHRDGANGLAIIGNFYLRQAIPLLIPLGWLSYWMAEIYTNPNYREFSMWLGGYLALIVIVLVALTLGFVCPILITRDRIVQWKERFDVQQRVAQGKDKQFIYDVATLPETPFSLDTIRMATVSIIFPILLGFALSVLR